MCVYLLLAFFLNCHRKFFLDSSASLTCVIAHTKATQLPHNLFMAVWLYVMRDSNAVLQLISYWGCPHSPMLSYKYDLFIDFFHKVGMPSHII